MNATLFKSAIAVLLLIITFAAAVGAPSALAGEQAEDNNVNTKSINTLVAELDAALDAHGYLPLQESEEQDVQNLAIDIGKKLSWLSKQTDGDEAKVIQQILRGNDQIILRAFLVRWIIDCAPCSERIDPLKVLSRSDAAKLAVRITLQGKRKEEAKALLALSLRYTFLRLTSEHEIIEATVPHLKTDDIDLRKELYKNLDAVLHGSFGVITNRLDAQKGKFDDRLVEYMLLREPEEGLVTLANYFIGDERDPVLLAYRTLDTVIWKSNYHLEQSPAVEAEQKDALATFAEHEQWWARLYAAQLMEQDLRFRRRSTF